MSVGYWCSVLHAHLPYVRHPERPHFLEEDWFFEALTETYVPLVIARFDYLYRALVGSCPLEEPIVREFEERDNIFPEIDYRVYR